MTKLEVYINQNEKYLNLYQYLGKFKNLPTISDEEIIKIESNFGIVESDRPRLKTILEDLNSGFDEIEECLNVYNLKVVNLLILSDFINFGYKLINNKSDSFMDRDLTPYLNFYVIIKDKSCIVIHDGMYEEFIIENEGNGEEFIKKDYQNYYLGYLYKSNNHTPKYIYGEPNGVGGFNIVYYLIGVSQN